MKNNSIVIVIVLSLLFLSSGFAHCAFFCPDSETALQNDLNTAASNMEDDTIQIVQGDYYGNFSYASSKGFSITIKGGYLKAGLLCLPPLFPPTASKTILDGQGSGPVLDIRNNNPGGAVAVSKLTIRNGVGYSAAGGGIYVYSQGFHNPGMVEIANTIVEDNEGPAVVLRNHAVTGDSSFVSFVGNIVRNNTKTSAGGGARITSSANVGLSGIIEIQGNIITNNESSNGGGIEVRSDGPAGTAPIFIEANFIIGNKALSGSGGGINIVSESASSDFGTIEMTNNIIAENNAVGLGGGIQTTFTSANPTGDIYLTHNTVAANHSDDSGGGMVLNGEKFFMVHNNIIWGNSDSLEGGDIVIPLGKGFAKNNNYSDLVGVWFEESESSNDNPYFMGFGDYHLQPSSPCRNKGSNDVPLPSKDIDGKSRNWDGAPDLGADEIDEYYYPWPIFIPARTKKHQE